MDPERLKDFEGMIVCCFHKISKGDKTASRIARGIIYQGAYHDIFFRMNGRPSIPTLYLEPIDPGYIEDISRLNEGQQTDIEKIIAEALRARLENEIKITLPLVFSKYSIAIAEEKKEEAERKGG